MPKSAQVYQLKVSLKQIAPPIWRRIVVPDNISLDILHVIIQLCMGWNGSHLHEFDINDRHYSLPDEEDEFYDFNNLDESDFKLNTLGFKEGSKFTYTYDFGDGWEHSILVEKISPAETGVKLPVCLKGKRACPPEDVGGAWGYADFLEALHDPNHEDHEDCLEWAGDFDAEYFNLTEVNQALQGIKFTTSGELDIRASEDELQEMATFQKELLDPLKPLLKSMPADEIAFFIPSPLRKNILIMLEYLQKNHVVGTEKLGNLPLKAVREIYKKFDNVPMPAILLQPFLQTIRSEDDVEQLVFVHKFAYISKLIEGGKKIPWKITPAGEQFQQFNELEQTTILFLSWLMALGLDEDAEDEDISCDLPFEFHFSLIEALFQCPAGIEMTYTDFWNIWAEEHHLPFEKMEGEHASEIFQALIEQTIMIPMIEFGVIKGKAGEAMPVLDSDANPLSSLRTFQLTPLGKSLGEIIKRYVGRK